MGFDPSKDARMKVIIQLPNQNDINRGIKGMQQVQSCKRIKCQGIKETSAACQYVDTYLFFQNKSDTDNKMDMRGVWDPQKGVFRRPPLAAVPGGALVVSNGGLGGGLLSPSVGRMLLVALDP